MSKLTESSEVKIGYLTDHSCVIVEVIKVADWTVCDS